MKDDSSRISWFRPLKRAIKLLVLGFVYLPFSFLFLLMRIRIVVLTSPHRIGHLCVEPDTFLKERFLGLQATFKPVFLIPKDIVANRAMLRLWQQKLSIVTMPALCRILAPFKRFRWVDYPIERYAVAIDSTAASPAIQAKWGSRPPMLMLDEKERMQGFEALEKLGIPRTGWFVCVHSRDGNYSPGDEHLHSYRNCKIGNYRLAMNAIVERGGWCVRVGEPTSIAFPDGERFIDYANSPQKSEWMDIFLAANCHFFLGNSSGLFFLSMVFGRRSALANMVPMSCSLPVGPGDLGIPKLLRSRESGELIMFRSILQSPVSNFRFSWQYEQAGIDVEENSPEDIRDLAVEMLDSLAGEPEREAADEQLQEQFHGLFRPGHYSYGAGSRIGRDFLREHGRLL